MSVKDRSVVVVGGTSGMGYATAALFAEQGARIAVVGRDADKAAQAAAALGGDVVAAGLDAADADALGEFMGGLAAVDHVVSFTGLQPAARVGDTDHEIFGSAFDARVWAARNCCAIAAPMMPPDGSFTFCSGLSAIRPRPGRSPGAVATAAVESFCRAMAVELAPIRVNALCPGAFDTEVLRRALGPDPEAGLARLGNSIPLGRIGQPEEIAHAVQFLVTNTYTTGITLRVDGGALLV
ncbi:SDR family oxidoreductase [Candidatus Poriferisocius sp.]|uniref:SDR family oxidoreductase n=1 Tax=Candidatus Poriferisocius sp. TaxID=3101276 RepID=UPI003B595A62